MEKRYQVFISSTFADLEEERKAIMEAIVNLNCFPAGMEMFPANDSEQFEYIKSIIDESDYYILVIAGRYGSIADDGKSYTEKEFDYAKEKGIPVLVFVKKDITSIPVNKTDDDVEKRKKLEQFRKKAMNDRLAKYWDDWKELKYEVFSSLSKSFKTNPRIGWIKGNIENDDQLLRQVNKLRIENEELNSKISIDKSYLDTDDLATGDEKFEVKFKYTTETMGKSYEGTMELSWDEIISLLCPGLIIPQSNTDLKKYFENIIKEKHFERARNLWIDDYIYDTIKVQLLVLGLIEQKDNFMNLTEKGKQILFSIKAIKKNK
ncbi:DUF4062 domain-containing protein [Clostridium algidicarnis]|uniref:DUF4062 domain-containing protein n=1 Tax=Clostridium algidicarnis TaxID=37659 RepID=UPI00162331F8|nr:DUF4062 domain-containing protein [Clostridium algidicarnis]MBB6696261.1 DUF4062 domain-containing protein [Clostridium algidicarnis]